MPWLGLHTIVFTIASITVEGDKSVSDSSGGATDVIMSTRTARILSFARPPQRVSGPPSPRGGSGRRITEWATSSGVPIAVTSDLRRLPPASHEHAVRERDAPSSGQRVDEVTAELADAPALEVLAHLYGRTPRGVARFRRALQTNANFLLCGRAGARRRSAASSSSVSKYRNPSGPSRTARMRCLSCVNIDSRRSSSVLSLNTIRCRCPVPGSTGGTCI